MYQVFPDRFARSALADERPTPDWAIPASWDTPVDPVMPARSQQFYGGDLDGVIEKLDHLVALGVNLLYLTPIFPAASNHRYDAASFDRVLMVHMYHEIQSPYEFLWNLRPSVKPDGAVVVVDADRATQNHGTPPALLACEFAAVGYRQIERQRMPSAGGYIAMFRPAGPRPDPAAITPCRTATPADASANPG